MEFKKLQSDMVAAMKARDKARKDTISSLISAVKKLAIDEGKRDDIPEELVDRAIIKEEKTAQEQVDSCPADREDLKAEYLLPTLIGELLSEHQLEVRVLKSHDQWFGVTYQADKQTVVDSIRKLIADGVYKEHLYD